MPLPKLDMKTPDFTDINIEKLAKLFPNIITESKDEKGNTKKAIDFDLLRQELSSDIVDGVKERYSINWPGKKEALLKANEPISKTLRPCIDESINFDTTQNLYIEGDNLEALKLLQESYLNKIKIIYIDPPYNTGKDFVYKDNFTQDKDEFLKDDGQKDIEGGRLVANLDSNGRYHSDWLSMMYPRLKLARNLLKDDGIIFISIDDNEVHNLRKICDEIFGEDNFIEIFIWDKKNSAKGVPPKNMVVNIHEYVVCYGKSLNSKLLGEKRPEESFSNPDNDPRGIWRQSNIKSTIENKNKFTIIDPTTGNEFSNYWAFSKSTLFKMIKEDRVIFPKKSTGLPKQKEFFKEFKNLYMPIKSHLGLFDAQSSSEREISKLLGSNIFPYRKPIDLIYKLISQSDNKNDIILDFFSGSATTAHAVMQLNSEDGGDRKYICVQIPENTDETSEAYKAGYKNICEIGKEKIRRAGKKIIEDNKNSEAPKNLSKLDIGFRVLKIDSSNMKDVYYTADTLTQENLFDTVENIKEDREPLDLLFGVLIDWGLRLNDKIEKRDINGKNVYIVDENKLVACFDDNLSEEFINELAKISKDEDILKVVFKDSGFDSDDTKDNVEQIFKQLAPNTDIRAI